MEAHDLTLAVTGQGAPEAGETSSAAHGGEFPDFFVDRASPLWVLHTRARHEKKVAESLAQSGVPHYLPLATSERTYGARRIRFQLPLFPGYVFVAGGQTAVDLAWRTRRVAHVIPVADPATLRGELRQVRQVLATGELVNLYPALRDGRRCRVVAGPLAGTEGVVLRWRSRSRLYLAVTMIGQSAVVEIDAALLEALD